MQFTNIILQTGSLKDIRDFYSSLLQLPVTASDKLDCTFQVGKTSLAFHQNNNGTSPYYHFAFNIPGNLLYAAQDWLKAKISLLFISEKEQYIADFRNWNAKSIYFLDTTGNVVELIARFDLNDVDTEPFSPLHLRNVSEIGLVFPAQSFDEDVESLLKNYQVEYFSKQPPLQQFRAIGNDEGLFIVVPQNRAWYPTTNHLSMILPMKIHFKNKNGEHVLRT